MKPHHGMAVCRELTAERHHGIDACCIDVRKHQCRGAGFYGTLHHLGAVGIEFFAIDMAVGINEFHGEMKAHEVSLFLGGVKGCSIN